MTLFHLQIYWTEMIAFVQGTKQATSHILNNVGPIHWFLYASLDPNELSKSVISWL